MKIIHYSIIFLFLLLSYLAVSYSFAQPIPASEVAWIPITFDGVTNTSQYILKSRGFLGYYHCYNPNATAVYLQVYDKSGLISVGTTKSTIHPGLPPGSGAVVSISNRGLRFSYAIQIAATTTPTGGAAPSIPIDCNFGYLEAS